MHNKNNPKNARQQKDGRFLNNVYIWTILYIKYEWILRERDRERGLYYATSFTLNP